MALLNLACRLSGHRVNRSRVWHDGMDFRTTCTRCSLALIRSPAGWRAFDETADAHLHREPHPRERQNQS